MSIVLDRVLHNICNIIIRRPDKRNALNLDLIKKLTAILDIFEQDDHLKVAIISGEGGNFCSGYDINELINEKNGHPNIHQIEQMLCPLGTRLTNNKITIASIDGHAVGFGYELALKCDFRIADRAARLGFLNRRLGVPIMNGGTVILPKLVGLARAKELIATGKAQLTPEALNQGIITHICDIGCSLGRSINLARCLAKYPHEALMLDLSQLVNQNSKDDMELLKQERANSLNYLRTCGPLENAVRFLKGELGRHGNMDMGNLSDPIPKILHNLHKISAPLSIRFWWPDEDMRTRNKFIKELFGISLKNVKQLEVQFDPFHRNSPNVREFWAGITDKKALKTNPELITKAKIVSDGSDPLVLVQYIDEHKLVINGKYLESGHFLQLIRQFEVYHKNEAKDDN